MFKCYKNLHNLTITNSISTNKSIKLRFPYINFCFRLSNHISNFCFSKKYTGNEKNNNQKFGNNLNYKLQ